MAISKASILQVIFALMIVTFVPNNGAETPAEIYWKTKVGNIPMPKTLNNSLQLGSNNGIVKLNPNYKPNFVNEGIYTYHVYTHPASTDLAGKSQLFQDGRAVYFTYDTLSKVGTKLKLYFQKIDNEVKFLPLHVAKSMPATSDKLQLILNLLSVNPKSSLAQDIEITMKNCEEEGVKDEKRYCATSLEDMVDYVTSILNSGKKKLMAISTEEDNGKVMEYTIQKVQKLGNDDNRNVVCHKMSNPYVVFLCHDIQSTDSYGVSLVGDNGKQIKGVAVCHKDTSSWNPSNYAFQFLKIKPGEKPICHFISADAIVWFQN